MRKYLQWILHEPKTNLLTQHQAVMAIILV